MAYYDKVFADMTAKMTALLEVIAAHPEIQDEVRVAWTAKPQEILVDDPDDLARANALEAVLRAAEQSVGIQTVEVVPGEAAAPDTVSGEASTESPKSKTTKTSKASTEPDAV